MENIVIAIDGPSGAGKSSIARKLSSDLGITYLDTGAMYRGVALYFDRRGISVSDEKKVAELIGQIKIEVKIENGENYLFLEGEDVSREIRQNHISKMASDVSAYPFVRTAMVEKQREIAKGQSIILDGREIGTFVFPDAKVKFYLDASVDVRAKRRQLELEKKGEVVDFEVLKQQIEMRDYNDKNREFAPLRQADDAILVDTSNMTFEMVVEYLKGIIEKNLRG